MIEVSSLSKWFGAVHAVDNVSFKVERGDVLGFLGPNGAGKSTTMRMITGFLPPSSGRVLIDGTDVDADPLQARAKVGYLPENAPVYPEMSVQGFLNFVAEIHGLRGAPKKEAVERVVKMCHLEGVRHQTVETLSKGYRHRTCFAQSILADPPILVFDEPTDGLDPNQKREVRDLIRQMGRSKAIVLSTHILEEVEAVCNRVIIIDAGKLVFNGTPDEFRGHAPTAGCVLVRVTGGGKPADVRSVLDPLNTVGQVDIPDNGDKDRCYLRVRPARGTDGGRKLAAIVAETLSKHSIRFDELHAETGRMDEVFAKLTTPDTRQSDGREDDDEEESAA